MVLVDSSIWIEAGRAKGLLDVKVGLESLLENFEASWNGVVKLEVIGWTRGAERARVRRFFSVIPYLPMNDALWEAAKNLHWRLRDAGVTVPSNDSLLAAHALDLGLRVYAIDSDFDEIARVVPELRLYQPGPGGSYAPDGL